MVTGGSRIEQRLAAVRAEVVSLRETLAVLEEQLAFVEEEAAEAGARAVVEGTPLARRERERAEGDARRARRARDEVAERIAALGRETDDLLEQLLTASTGGERS